MQVPIKHQTSLKSTNSDRSENQPTRKLGGKNQPMTDRVRNQPIRKLGGKNQPMTDKVWNAGFNQTPALTEAKINQSESLAGKTSSG
jgi:hypothetical protein